MTRHPHYLSIAILQACGIPHENVKTVEFFHDITGTPELTVTYLVPNFELGFVEEVTQVWEMKMEARRG